MKMKIENLIKGLDLRKLKMLRHELNNFPALSKTWEKETDRRRSRDVAKLFRRLQRA